MLQHAVIPNSVGALVAWQQEDEVHVCIVEVKPRVKADNTCFNRSTVVAYRGCQDEIVR